MVRPVALFSVLVLITRGGFAGPDAGGLRLEVLRVRIKQLMLWLFLSHRACGVGMRGRFLLGLVFIKAAAVFLRPPLYSSCYFFAGVVARSLDFYSAGLMLVVSYRAIFLLVL